MPSATLQATLTELRHPVSSTTHRSSEQGLRHILSLWRDALEKAEASGEITEAQLEKWHLEMANLMIQAFVAKEMNQRAENLHEKIGRFVGRLEEKW